jgi:hypothetical protein
VTDQTLRFALVILLLLFVPVGVYHRVRSQTTGERLDRRQEGLFILVSLRLAGVLFSLGLLAWLIESSWLAWSSVPLPDGPRWLGVGLLAAWTFHHLGRNLTDTVVTRRQHSLVAEPGQTVPDICEAEAAFVQTVADRHPHSPRPAVVGNCQGGWSASLLTEILSDITGVTGRIIIRAILRGTRSPEKLAKHRDKGCKASEAEIAQALTGSYAAQMKEKQIKALKRKARQLGLALTEKPSAGSGAAEAPVQE